MSLKKVVVLFPGQGCQGLDMLETSSEIHQEVYSSASDILGIDLQKFLKSVSIQKLSQSDMLQAIIFVHGVAQFRAFIKNGETSIDYLLGHSLGEITALHCAGAFEFKAALDLVTLRSKLMIDISKDYEELMMLVCMHLEQSSLDQIEKFLSDRIKIVCFNSPTQVVIAGLHDEVQLVESELHSLNFLTKKIPMPTISHHPFLQPGFQKYRDLISSVKNNNNLSYPVISCFNGRPNSEKNLVENLSMLLTSPVRFQEAVNFLNKEGATWVDLSPKSFFRPLLLSNGVSGSIVELNEKVN